MKNALLKRINSILNEEEGVTGFEAPEDTTSVDDITTDFSTDEVPTEDEASEEVPTEDEASEEEVETLTSYVAGVEEMLTPEQKEEVKSFIQGVVDGASEEGSEGGEEIASDETGEGEEMVEVPEEPIV